MVGDCGKYHRVAEVDVGRRFDSNFNEILGDTIGGV